MGIVDYFIWNDIHFPFEDRQRYELSLRIAVDLHSERPLAGIYLNGDIGEFQAVSTHPIHPGERGISLNPEIAYCNKKFDELQAAFPDVPVTLLEGNHCYRFFRYIRDVAPALWGLIDCPQIFRFHERPRWKFVPYGPTQLVQLGSSRLWLRHEPLSGGQNHAKGTAEKAVVDIAYGHTHTYQVNIHRKFGPSPVITKAYSLGWLGDKTRHVFDYRGSKDNWVTGFTHVEADEESGDYGLTFVCLDKLPVFFRGRRYDLAVRTAD